VAVVGVAVSVFIGSLSSLHFVVGGDDPGPRNVQEGRALILIASKDLRAAVVLQEGATPFVLAADHEVRFYARIDASGAYVPAPRLVRLYVDPSGPGGPILVEEVTAPDPWSVAPNWTYDRNPPVIRLTGRYVVNPATTPVFAYYDAAGSMLGPTPLSPDRLHLVRSVGITLVVAKSSAQYAAATTLINRVTIPPSEA
jgi:hypothetical protein